MKSALLCSVIVGPSLEEIKKQIEQVNAQVDLLEMRFDKFVLEDFSPFEYILKSCIIPMIFTLRPLRQGGEFKGSEEERMAIFAHLLSFSPAYVDLEYDVSEIFLVKVRETHPLVKIILSYHDFKSEDFKLGLNLDGILKIVKAKYADCYKIAVTLDSILDSFSLLQFAKAYPQKLIVQGMGSYGQITRILGSLFLEISCLMHA